MEEKLYSTTEVAEALAVSNAYIRKLVKEGKAQPKQRIGKNWVFTLEEIERLRTRPKSKGGRPRNES